MYVFILFISLIVIVYLLGNYDLPKIIWTHWNNNELPDICKETLQRMRDVHPDWKIRFITDAEFQTMCPQSDFPLHYEQLKPAHKSDFIRLWLLKHYGGCWIDISTVFNKSITPIYLSAKAIRAEICGFYIDAHSSMFPKFENWFIMAPRNSQFIKQWYDEYVYAVTIGFENYKRLVINEGVLTHGIYEPQHGVYLTQHACFQRIIQRKRWLRPRWLLYRADDSMLKIQLDCGWNQECNRSNFSSYKAYKLPAIKLVNDDRKTFPLSFFHNVK
jgi:hypothetical protein